MTGDRHGGPQGNVVARTLLTAGGGLCVGLGVLGMFLPLLPTTPFLLLAAVCFARSSRRSYDWLMSNRWCGRYIRDYREGRGMSPGHKVLTLLLLWAAIGYAAACAVSSWWARLLLLGVAVGVTIHLIRLPFRSAKGRDAAGGPSRTAPGSTALTSAQARTDAGEST